MTSSALSRALRRAPAWPLLLALTLGFATACSDGDGDDPGPGDTSSSAAGDDDALVSGADDPFELVEHEGTTYVVGHRVLLEVPADWEPFSTEKTTPDKKATLWSVGQAADAKPFPAGLQFEMAAPAGRNKSSGDPLQRSEVLMEITPGYRMIESGEAVVPGALEAVFHRFENQIEVGNQRVQAERIHLFVNTGPRTWSTIRFIAPAGRLDALLKPAFDSVRITRES